MHRGAADLALLCGATAVGTHLGQCAHGSNASVIQCVTVCSQTLHAQHVIGRKVQTAAEPAV